MYLLLYGFFFLKEQNTSLSFIAWLFYLCVIFGFVSVGIISIALLKCLEKNENKYHVMRERDGIFCYG